MPEVAYHGWTHRRKRWGGTDPIPGESFRNIKVFADENACDGLLPDSVRIVSTGNGKFMFQIDDDEDGFALVLRAGVRDRPGVGHVDGADPQHHPGARHAVHPLHDRRRRRLLSSTPPPRR